MAKSRTKNAAQKHKATAQQAHASAVRTAQNSAQVGPKASVNAPGKKPPKPPGKGKPGPEAKAKPPEPAKVDPFFTPEDLVAINDFTTAYTTSLADIDFGLGELGRDVTYEKTQTDKAAKQNTSNAQESMVARGLFQSSIKDAALYDIEANRVLATKFLDDKLTSATLNAGTKKKTLADSKKRFDEAMLAKQTANATGVNDAAAAAWADAMAAAGFVPDAAAPAPVAAAPAAPAAPQVVAPKLVSTAPQKTTSSAPKVASTSPQKTTKLKTPAAPKAAAARRSRPKRLRPSAPKTAGTRTTYA